MAMPIRLFFILLTLNALGGISSAWALDISGSSTVMPIVQEIAPIFEKQTGEPVHLEGGGSSVGIKDAISGTSQIGMASRALHPNEAANAKSVTIGYDALAIIVNKHNTISEINKSQLIDLYTGRVKNWKELGGPDRAVVLVSSEVGRSTLELFEHYTGLVSSDSKKSGPHIDASAYKTGPNIEALTLVGGLRGAIGYVSVGAALDMKKAGMPIKILPLEGIMPDAETIRSGRYPLTRPLNLVYTSRTPVVNAFIELVLSPAGQKVVRKLGYVPVSK